MTDIPNKSNKSATAAADTDSIVSEIEIAAPAQRIFQALTDERELIRWFTDPGCPVKLWKMDARPGGHYRYATEKGTSWLTASASSSVTEKFSSSFPRASSSIPGSPTGTKINRCA